MAVIFRKRLATVIMVALVLLGMGFSAACQAQNAPMPGQQIQPGQPGQAVAPVPPQGTPPQAAPKQGEDYYMAKLASVRPNAEPMPITVKPWYYSQGPRVQVDKYSIGLASRDPKVVLRTISDMSRAWSELRAEAMYVAAVRLYDLGLKDDAFYWFQAAKHRSLLVVTTLAPEKKANVLRDPTIELQMSFGEFTQKAGTYINGHAYGDINKAIAITRSFQNAGRKVPDLAKAYPKLNFIEQAAWEKKNQEALGVFNQLIDQLQKNAAQIRAERVQNGIEGKY